MSHSSEQSRVNDFVVRIAYLDYYMAPRVVDHDRQFYPYFFVDATAHSGFPASGDRDQLMQWMSDFRSALNQAINDGLAEQGRARTSRQHVHSLSLVCGSQFFGYEDRETPFLRLQLYNPRMVARAAGVLRAGSVLGTPFQPHEAHVPYLLQLLLDFNLKGMGDLRLARFKFRLPLPDRALSRRNFYREMTVISARAEAARRVLAEATRGGGEAEPMRWAQAVGHEAEVAASHAAAAAASAAGGTRGSSAESVSEAWTASSVGPRLWGPRLGTQEAQASLGALGVAVRDMLAVGAGTRSVRDVQLQDRQSSDAVGLDGTQPQQQEQRQQQHRPHQQHQQRQQQPPEGRSDRGALGRAFGFNPSQQDIGFDDAVARAASRILYPRKQSSCALEVDANVADILNARELVSSTQSLLRKFSAESHGPLASGSSASSVARQGISGPQLPRMDAVRSLGEIWEEEVARCLREGESELSLLPPPDASQRSPVPESPTQRALRKRLDAVVRRLEEGERERGADEARLGADALCATLPLAQLSAERARVAGGDGGRQGAWEGSVPPQREALVVPATVEAPIGSVAGLGVRRSGAARGRGCDGLPPRTCGGLTDAAGGRGAGAAQSGPDDAAVESADEGLLGLVDSRPGSEVAVLGSDVRHDAAVGACEDRDLELVLRMLESQSEDRPTPVRTPGSGRTAVGSPAPADSGPTAAELDLGATTSDTGTLRLLDSAETPRPEGRAAALLGPASSRSPFRRVSPRRGDEESDEEGGSCAGAGGGPSATTRAALLDVSGDMAGGGDEEEDSGGDSPRVTLPWSQSEFAPPASEAATLAAAARAVRTSQGASSRALGRTRSSEWDDIAASQREELARAQVESDIAASPAAPLQRRPPSVKVAASGPSPVALVAAAGASSDSPDPFPILGTAAPVPADAGRGGGSAEPGRRHRSPCAEEACLAGMADLGWDVLEEIERGEALAAVEEDGVASGPRGAARQPPAASGGSEASPSAGRLPQVPPPESDLRRGAGLAAEPAAGVAGCPPPRLEAAATALAEAPVSGGATTRPSGDGDDHVEGDGPSPAPAAIGQEQLRRWRSALGEAKAAAASLAGDRVGARCAQRDSCRNALVAGDGRWLLPRVLPPPRARLTATWTAYGLPETRPDAERIRYAREADVPARAVEFAGKVFRLPGPGLRHLETFDTATSRTLCAARRASLWGNAAPPSPSAASLPPLTARRRALLTQTPGRTSEGTCVRTGVVQYEDAFAGGGDAVAALGLGASAAAASRPGLGALKGRFGGAVGPRSRTAPAAAALGAFAPQVAALFGGGGAAALAALRRRRGRGQPRRHQEGGTDWPGSCGSAGVWLAPTVPPAPHPAAVRAALGRPGPHRSDPSSAAPAPPVASSALAATPTQRQEAAGGMTDKALRDATAARARRAAAAAAGTGGGGQRGERGGASASSAAGEGGTRAAHDLLTLLSVEVLCASRGGLRPDPAHDAVLAVCYEIQEGDHICFSGAIACGPHAAAGRLGLGSRVRVDGARDEVHLLLLLAAVVEAADPDFVVGYEVQRESLGYLCDRAERLRFPLAASLSRTPSGPLDPRHRNDAWGETHGSGIWLVGRIVLNLWRSLRKLVKLPIYTAEHVAWETLRRRVPRVPLATLARWATGGSGGLARALRLVLQRARLNLDILRHLDFIQQTSEMSRVYGIDFASTLMRGSQFRVEAVMLRVSRPLNYVLPSPSPEQVSRQAAMECVPLIMEPVSDVYTDPVVVLDFQSLYPTVMIAHNMCFSTLLARLDPSDEDGSLLPRIGFAPWAAPRALPGLARRAFVAPNGSVFASRADREGVLPRMLRDILDTRVMIKHAMKRAHGGDAVLRRVRDARQMALKMIANVTYGYAGAGYSGRMPCAELADAIVETGRAALERAIATVEGDPDWAARVVYGDTDSLFVLLPGRTREEAFRVGREIAARVTADNPEPMKLKLEKVYLPSALVSKKRYVGASFEHEADKVRFDAKGIETVRRDACGLVAQTMERVLRVLFGTRDMSRVRAEVVRSCADVLAGRVPLRQCVFAKEVKLGRYRRPATLPPAAVVATRAMLTDPRAEPRYKQRVPYLVVHGAPGSRLVDLVVSPEALASPRSGLRLNGVYYVTRQLVPALARVLNLAGGDVEAWVREMRRPPPQQRLGPRPPPPWAFISYDAPEDLALAARAPGGRDGGAAGDAVGAWLRGKGRVLRIGARARAILDAGDGGTEGGAGAAARRESATVDRFFLKRQCALCAAPSSGDICARCARARARSATAARMRAQVAERRLAAVRLGCRHCAGSDDAARACVNTDCDVFFLRCKLQEDATLAAHAAAAVMGQAAEALAQTEPPQLAW